MSRCRLLVILVAVVPRELSGAALVSRGATGGIIQWRSEAEEEEAEEESRESATTELNRPTDSSVQRLLFRSVCFAHRFADLVVTDDSRTRDRSDLHKYSARVCRGRVSV